MDLEALGLIIHQLLLSNENKLYEFTWQKIATQYYKKNINVPLFGILEHNKNLERTNNTFIYNYLTILDDIGWFDKKPEYFIYEDLRNLIKEIT
jgi:hypothetical protein